MGPTWVLSAPYGPHVGPMNFAIRECNKKCKNLVRDVIRTFGTSKQTILYNLLYCICYTLWIDWLMDFGLEQEGGSVITPMALAHPLHPIYSRSREKRWNLWDGRCVSSWWHLWPLFSSRTSVLIYIYRYVCILMRVLVVGRIYTYTGSVA